MESPGQQDSLIHEVKNKKVIPPKQDQQPTKRIARYLKPISENSSSNPPVPIPNTPLLSEIFPHEVQDWPVKVIFKGWNSPQRRWQEWVESSTERHGAVWERTGIRDAVAASVYEVGFNSDLLLGLAEFWCPETNTFVFPWGEGGLTLEDVAVLGGLPVVGEEVAGISLSEEMVTVVEEMEKHRARICRSRAKKAAHSEWLKLFMGEDFQGSELEHVGFLSLWLSRFVFPSLAEEVIGRHVFPIAAALSKGEPMAIAPAVLANLYKDLRGLKEKALDSAMICVSAPFQLLTLWAFEHFPAIGPTSISLQPGEPRIARWNNLNWEITLPLIRSALQLSKNFKWRPYSADLENWHHRSCYKETGQSLCYTSALDVDLRSFFQCLKASELVSIDGHKEKYLPNRVAMQFGMDQDIPSDLSGLNFTSENVRFFVPPKSFTPGVSGRYMDWWKDVMVNRETLIKDVVVERRNELVSKDSTWFKESGNGENFHGSNVPKCSIADDARKSNISIASKILEGLGKLSPVKTKLNMNKKGELDSPDILSGIEEQMSSDSRNNGEGSLAMDSKVSSSGQAKKSKISIGSSTPKSCCKLKSSPDSTKPNLKLNHDAKSPEIPRWEKEQIDSDSWDDDNVPIATLFNLNHDDPKTTSSSHQEFTKTASENSQKRKLLTKEVKAEVGCSVNEPIEIDELAGAVKRQKVGREVEGETQRKTGASLDNPIDLDDYMDIDTCGCRKGGIDWQRRVEKLEKLLGVDPD